MEITERCKASPLWGTKGSGRYQAATCSERPQPLQPTAVVTPPPAALPPHGDLANRCQLSRQRRQNCWWHRYSRSMQRHPMRKQRAYASSEDSLENWSPVRYLPREGR